MDLAHLREALKIFAVLGEEDAVGDCFDEFANAAVNAGDLDRAGVLYGAACRIVPLLREGSSISPETVDTLPKSSLDAGSELTLGAAIRYALETDGDRVPERRSNE